MRALKTLALIFVVFFGMGSVVWAQGDPIKIGFQGPLTGSWAYEGDLARKCAELAVKLINKEGGVMGRQIKLIVEDDAGTPRGGVLAAQRLIAAGAKAVVQTYGSPTVEACYGVYEEAKLLSIGYGCTFVGLTAKKMNYWFRTCGRDDTQGIFFADNVVPLFNAKKITLMHNFTTFAVGVANETIKALKDEIQAGDVKIVYNEGIRPEEQDFTPALTALKNTKPDLFYYTGHFAEGGLIARQSKDLGMGCPFVGSNAVINNDFIKTAGDAAIGCLMTTEPMPADLPFTGAKKFLTAFKSEYGAIPDSPWAIYAADAINTIAFAMQWVGLVNPSNMTDSTVLANVLHSGKVVGDGITGPLSFTREGDRVGVPNMLYIVDKDYKIVLYDANKHSKLVDRKK